MDPITGEAPWRAKAQAVGTMVVGVAVAGLGLTALYSDFHTRAEVQAYSAASICPAPVDALSGDACRYTGVATVLETSEQSTLSVALSLNAFPDRDFVATFAISDEPAPSSLTRGATAAVEVWNGEVTKYAGVHSLEDPELAPQNLGPGGWGFSAAGLGVLGLGIFLATRAWRRHST